MSATATIPVTLSRPGLLSPADLSPFDDAFWEDDLEETGSDVSDWPPTDEAELAALDLWTDDRERERLERVGNDYDNEREYTNPEDSPDWDYKPGPPF